MMAKNIQVSKCAITLAALLPLMSVSIEAGVVPYVTSQPGVGKSSIAKQYAEQNNLKFITVNDVKFHFFQIDGWYFEVSQFNRPGFNTGWLISNLVKLNPGDKETIEKYIYDQK